MAVATATAQQADHQQETILWSLFQDHIWHSILMHGPTGIKPHLRRLTSLSFVTNSQYMFIWNGDIISILSLVHSHKNCQHLIVCISCSNCYECQTRSIARLLLGPTTSWQISKFDDCFVSQVLMPTNSSKHDEDSDCTLGYLSSELMDQ